MVRIFYLIFLLTPFFGYTQVVGVTNMSANTVELGKTNRLQIVVENSSCNSLVVSTDNGKIARVGACNYDFTPAKSGMAQIVVFSSSRSNPYNYLLRVTSGGREGNNSSNNESPVVASGITAYVGKQNGGFIPANNLALQEGLYVKEASAKKPEFVVRKYSYIITRDSRIVANNINNGARFSSALKRDIETMKSGDRLLFYNIDAIDLSSRSVWVTPIEFIIR